MVIEAGVRIPDTPKTSIMLGMPGTSPSNNQAKKTEAMTQPAMPNTRRKRLNVPGSRMCLCLRNRKGDAMN